MLEFIPEEPRKDRFTLLIDHLTLENVREIDPVRFHARLKNTEPSADIRSDGQFGPWNETNPASTGLSVRTLMSTLSSVCSKASPGLYRLRENSAARLAI